MSRRPALENDQLRPAVRAAEGKREIPSRGRRAAGSADSVVYSGLGEPGQPPQACEGATRGREDLITKGHTEKGKDILTAVKISIPRKGKEKDYHLRMRSTANDPWPQRQHFRHLVDVWMEETGKTKKDFAALCDIEPNSLKQYYSGKQIPGRNLALRFAEVLKCPVAELIGDPGTVPAGVPPEEWAETPEDLQRWNNTMFHLGRNLAPEVRDAIISMAKAGQVVGKQRREDEKIGKSNKK